VIKGGVFNEDPTDYHLHLTTGDLTETSVILGTDEHNVRTTVDGGVEINTRDYEVNASKTWRFSSTGELTLPPSDPDNFFSGQIYASGDSGGFLNLNIQGMASEEDYGGVRLGNGNNKPVELWAGINTIFRFDSNGNLTLPKTTFSEEVTSGPAIVWPVEGAEGGGLVITDQGFLLVVEDKSWIFGLDGNLALPGNLVLPADGDILDSTGVSQTGRRVEGSWTLAPGANTVSFTVDWNYTYTMWVRGNIPNGIAVWNATVTVTNSNVPVVGTQYGWYYVDGGALVLTAIPAQIVGTAGSISTAAPAVGTTTNTFVFSITNNTQEAQTVYYGYTKI
jgi:hypothetical protein